MYLIREWDEDEFLFFLKAIKSIIYYIFVIVLPIIVKCETVLWFSVLFTLPDLNIEVTKAIQSPSESKRSGACVSQN